MRKRLASEGGLRSASAGFLPADMPDLYPLIRPVLRRLPAEAARDLTLRALEAGLGRLIDRPRCAAARPADIGAAPVGSRFSEPDRARCRLRQGCAGARSAAAARLRLCRDRHGHAAAAAGQPEAARVPPRRGSGDRSIAWASTAAGSMPSIERLPRRRASGIVGVNLGKNRDSADAVADYAEGDPPRRAARRLSRGQRLVAEHAGACGSCSAAQSLRIVAAPAASSARRKPASGAAAGQDRARPHRRKSEQTLPRSRWRPASTASSCRTRRWTGRPGSSAGMRAKPAGSADGRYSRRRPRCSPTCIG